MRITVKREFFEERRVPFAPEYLRLGDNRTRGCGPVSEGHTSEMFIYTGLQECGTESRHRKQTVSGEPLTPTWLPMTSTISAFGLLHFSLHTMTDDWTSPRSSSVYQQGEAVFLEASIEAPLHPTLRIYVEYCVATLKSDPLSLPSYKFITNHGCLVDSVVPESSSKFLPREQDNKLRFSVQAFRFSQEFGDQMFISCHLRATLKQNPPDLVNKACFFHSPTFSWRATEGDSALCKCCGSGDCLKQTGGKLDGHTGDIIPADKGCSPPKYAKML
ncbi:zona pellucida sperm-binding protein 3-like [Polymixia lowei]